MIEEVKEDEKGSEVEGERTKGTGGAIKVWGKGGKVIPSVEDTVILNERLLENVLGDEAVPT